jgi:hypothetical protein
LNPGVLIMGNAQGVRSMRKTTFVAILLSLEWALSAWPAVAAQTGSGNPFAAYEGTYRLTGGEIIVVTRTGVIEEMARPCFLDWQTGRFGYLSAGGVDRFTAAASPSRTLRRRPRWFSAATPRAESTV